MVAADLKGYLYWTPQGWRGWATDGWDGWCRVPGGALDELSCVRHFDHDGPHEYDGWLWVDGDMADRDRMDIERSPARKMTVEEVR